MGELLKKLIAENLGLQAEIDALMAKEFERGQQSGKNRIEQKIRRVLPFLRADSCYPSAINDLACSVLAGQIEASALEGAIVLHDQQTEEAKLLAAIEETEEYGDTPSFSAPGENGIDELQSQINAGRERHGLGKE